MKRTLICAFVALQIADVVLTSHVLAHAGVLEANPLMALAQSSLGSWWWLPKLAIVAVCTPRLARLRTGYVMGAVAVMSAVVVNNAML